MQSLQRRAMALALRKFAGPQVLATKYTSPQSSSSPQKACPTYAGPFALRSWWRTCAHSVSSPDVHASQAPGRGLTMRAQAVATEGDELVPEAEGDEVVPEAEEGSVEEMGHVKTKALTKQVKHIMNILNEEATAAATKDKIIPDIRPGDVLAIRLEVPQNKRRISLVRGIVIAKSNAGINSTFRIRRIIAGVGVEMVFPLYSPNIKEIKVVDKRRARRAKLYYLRDKLARLSTVN